MNYFCTLFDSRYLSRGLALYESLDKCCEAFHLYIFAFDEIALELLERLNLKKATIVSLKDFEDAELLALKPTRSKMEYCWTCTPSIIRYSLDAFNLEACTYIDADLYFWSSPKPLFDEMGDCSVLLTEHRYTKRYIHNMKSGRYCVQFMTFRNDKHGRKALDWWRKACNDWCYARHEGGKFGDQKYLDDWIERFEGVHVLGHLGGGVAPWNIQQYELYERNGKICGKEIATGNEFDVIFYHFHHVRFYCNGELDVGGYSLPEKTRELFYRPYISHLEKVKRDLAKDNILIDPHGCQRLSWLNFEEMLRYCKRSLMKNIYWVDKFVKDSN